MTDKTERERHAQVEEIVQKVAGRIRETLDWPVVMVETGLAAIVVDLRADILAALRREPAPLEREREKLEEAVTLLRAARTALDTGEHLYPAWVQRADALLAGEGAAPRDTRRDLCKCGHARAHHLTDVDCCVKCDGDHAEHAFVAAAPLACDEDGCLNPGGNTVRIEGREAFRLCDEHYLGDAAAPPSEETP